MDEMGIFQAMHTARALRRLKPDPVPDDAIAKIIDAGVRAPTGSNLQNWRFVVIKAAEQRRQIANLYRASMEIAGRAYMNRKPPAHMTEERQKAMMSAAMYLAEHFAEVPVLILAWLQFTHEQENPQSGGGADAYFSTPEWGQHFPRCPEHDRCLPRSRLGYCVDDGAGLQRRGS
jgi:nitroreductase